MEGILIPKKMELTIPPAPFGEGGGIAQSPWGLPLIHLEKLWHSVACSIIFGERDVCTTNENDYCFEKKS